MRLFIVIILFVFYSLNINAEDRNRVNNLAIGFGSSNEHVDIYRVSLQNDLNKYLFDKNYKYLPSYYETSIGYWNGKDSSGLSSLSFTPMFRYNPIKFYDVVPYIEAGIGATYISKTKIRSENFGIHFQFENVVGLGFRYKDFDVSYRYMHYSNAGLSRYNSGMDFNLVTISYRF